MSDYENRVRALVACQGISNSGDLQLLLADLDEARAICYAWERRCDEARADLARVTAERDKARREALESAIAVCEARVMGDNNREDAEAQRCATAIRALIDKEGT